MEQKYDRGSQHAIYFKYDCLLFDLDDTLYPSNIGIGAHCVKNIQEYMIHELGIEESKVPEMCHVLYKYYGTTLAGLRAIGYNFNYDHFHSFVHGKLPYYLLKPDIVLRNLLLSLPIQRVIFTNADKRHTSEVLKRLELEDCFENNIICFETLNPTTKVARDDDSMIFDILKYQPNSGVSLPKTPVICKPFELAYERAFKITKIDPRRTLFFDDNISNVRIGKSLGLQTVLVEKSKIMPWETLILSAKKLKSNWKATNKNFQIRYSHKIAIKANYHLPPLSLCIV